MTVQTEMQLKDSDLLLQNHLSYRKYDTIRMAEAFETPEQARERLTYTTTPHLVLMVGHQETYILLLLVLCV